MPDRYEPDTEVARLLMPVSLQALHLMMDGLHEAYGHDLYPRQEDDQLVIVTGLPQQRLEEDQPEATQDRESATLTVHTRRPQDYVLVDLGRDAEWRGTREGRWVMEPPAEDRPGAADDR